MGPAATPLLCYLVEWYRTGLDKVQVEHIVAEIDRCVSFVAAEGTPVRRVLIMAVPEDDVVFGLFEADSSASIENVCARADIAALRITVAVADRILWPQM